MYIDRHAGAYAIGGGGMKTLINRHATGATTSPMVPRIGNVNNFNRSGDIILIMKDKASDDAHNRFTTAYACASWHGSLNKSDSYVPFILGYPGGNSYELNAVKDTVCASDTCNGNWILPSMIRAILNKQY